MGSLLKKNKTRNSLNCQVLICGRAPGIEGTGVIPKSLPTELVLRKAAVDREYGFRPSSADVDRGTR